MPSIDPQSQYWDRLAEHPLDASVIDPNDNLGFKNRYLAAIRDREITRALRLSACDSSDRSHVVMDLGCGTGSLSSALVVDGWNVVGVDISAGLLSRTPERGLAKRALFVLYDGKSLPVHSGSVDAVTTYVVLNHILRDDDLHTVLSECWRVLKPGGHMVCIEQVRRRAYLDKAGWKKQRTIGDFMVAFSRARLNVHSKRIVRFGHFPTTSLIRRGWLPSKVFPWIADFESGFGRLRGIARWDYCDVLFDLEKHRTHE